MPQHQRESNPPVAESNHDSNTRRAARHGLLLELDENFEISTCAVRERRSTSELIQHITGILTIQLGWRLLHAVHTHRHR